MFILIQSFRLFNVNHYNARSYDRLSLLLCILGNKLNNFVDSFDHHREQRGKCINFIQLNTLFF